MASIKITSGIIKLLFFGIIILIFLISGGFITIAKLGYYTTQIPVWGWAIIGIIILISMFKK